MTMTRDKIAELKRIAQNAWPGPWAMNPEPFDNDGTPETVISAMDGKAAICVTMDWGKNNPLMREANALHIAAFNPETASALLALAERALNTNPVALSEANAERALEPQGADFQTWFESYSPAGKGLRETMHDAYAFGCASQLVLEPQGQALPVAMRYRRAAREGAKWAFELFISDDDVASLRADGWEVEPLYASQLALPAGPVPEARALSMKVSEAVGLLDRILRDAPIEYADSHPNYFKVGAQAYRKRTLKDAKQDAKLAAKILREVWDELDPTITSIESKECTSTLPAVADEREDAAAFRTMCELGAFVMISEEQAECGIPYSKAPHCVTDVEMCGGLKSAVRMAIKMMADSPHGKGAIEAVRAALRQPAEEGGKS